jgi:hypothetical protein
LWVITHQLPDNHWIVAGYVALEQHHWLAPTASNSQHAEWENFFKVRLAVVED